MSQDSALSSSTGGIQDSGSSSKDASPGKPDFAPQELGSSEGMVYKYF
jgi:hypothetical protein